MVGSGSASLRRCCRAFRQPCTRLGSVTAWSIRRCCAACNGRAMPAPGLGLPPRRWPRHSRALRPEPPPPPAASGKRIQIDETRPAVRLPRGVRLDLGGSAKGMAVDMAAGLLATNPAFAIDAGGDIRIGGMQGTPRTVEITHPLHDRPVQRFSVTAGAVATSGLRTRVWATEDGFAHHLIDPARGEPAWTGVIQATALAPSTLQAETLAKIALLRGPLAGRATLERYGGALILDSGQLILVGNLQGVAEFAASDRRTA